MWAQLLTPGVNRELRADANNSTCTLFLDQCHLLRGRPAFGPVICPKPSGGEMQELEVKLPCVPETAPHTTPKARQSKLHHPGMDFSIAAHSSWQVTRLRAMLQHGPIRCQRLPPIPLQECLQPSTENELQHRVTRPSESWPHLYA